ncbi:hypothetical protein MMC11_007986 [Xylographa trunciseda]|nr:hypothetical protein [Xylographa trunciseda]
MPAIRFGAGDLLEYNSRYSLLICRECQYAIQKTALERHLLRHKIYRGDRQRLLSSIARLDLLEPHYVPLPAPGSPPVDALPILSGYRCTAAECQHLTASSKRMKRHWSEIHGLGGSVPISSSFARPVKLQTFFRGTKIRYFEVDSPAALLVNTDDGGHDGDDDHEGCEDEGLDAITLTPPPPPRLPAPLWTANGPSPADFNLETLTYFHHFITTTALALPGAADSQSVQHYWQTHVVPRALRRRWLMCGLLAISAHHMAALTHDTMTKRIHREQEAQFFSDFSAGLGQTTECDSGLEAAEIEVEAKKTGEQISCLLRCAQWALAEATLDYESVAPCQLLSIMSTIQGCVVPDSIPRRSGILNDGHGRQEELLTHEFLHTKNSSHGGNPSTNSSSKNTPSVLLILLRALPSRIAEVLGRPESAQDVFATISAITLVVECCDISFACDEAGVAWQGVATWLANVPDHFNQMVQHHHPAALVVLAYWAALLVKRAEHVGCWFLKGAAKIIVLQVARQLSVLGRAVLGLVECLTGILKD